MPGTWHDVTTAALGVRAWFLGFDGETSLFRETESVIPQSTAVDTSKSDRGQKGFPCTFYDVKVTGPAVLAPSPNPAPTDPGEINRHPQEGFLGPQRQVGTLLGAEAPNCGFAVGVFNFWFGKTNHDKKF